MKSDDRRYWKKNCKNKKAAIAQLVNNRFANFDESKIESYDLRKFLEDCRNGKY